MKLTEDVLKEAVMEAIATSSNFDTTPDECYESYWRGQEKMRDNILKRIWILFYEIDKVHK